MLSRCQHRSGHVAVCIEEDLLVWGGYQPTTAYHPDRYLDTHELWIFDSTKDVWKCRRCEGTCPPGTSGACGILLKPYWYIIGGHTDFGNVSDVYRLHLHTFTWEQVDMDGPGMSPRDKFTAWVYKEQIYCFGGFGRNAARDENLFSDHGTFVEDINESTVFNRCWNNQLLVLDVQARRWMNPLCKGPVPVPRAAHSAVLVHNTVYIFGGRHLNQRMNDLHRLDLDTLTWSGQLTTGGSQPIGRSWHTMAFVCNNSLLLYGGFSQDERALDDVWLLSLVTLQWTLVSPTNGYPLLWHTASTTQSGSVLVFGGCSNNILNIEYELKFSDQVIKFQMEPKGLMSLCMEVLVRHHRETNKEWSCLPKQIQRWLTEKHRLYEQWEKLDDELKKKIGLVAVSGFRVLEN
ncbi:kelch domain-containing protein 2-like isoform X2 [Pomacea canaliculata]|uniref:kelch domain-containing protein 2-like isoform X2 n=1 Tax=Pomacea canaliculata TaxID=400727 RepID=UPI000D728725|nr:kelch domain-containing protein 2-like isoform X2 [Pomacea canaliculata]